LLQSAWKPARTQCAAAFSTSNARRAVAGEGDEELIAKLESEIEMENQMKDAEGVPTSVKDYIENGPFEVLDVPGSEEVVLTRDFGDEKYAYYFLPLFCISIDIIAESKLASQSPTSTI
jgi:complement component 1 Q subcomponent-binding protein